MLSVSEKDNNNNTLQALGPLTDQDENLDDFIMFSINFMSIMMKKIYIFKTFWLCILHSMRQ